MHFFYTLWEKVLLKSQWPYPNQVKTAKKEALVFNETRASNRYISHVRHFSSYADK